MDFSFAIPNDITVPVSDGIAFFDDVDVFEGAFLTSNFTVSSLNPQRYILDNANIDTSSITVTVRDSQASTTSRKFVLSDNLFSVTSTSRVFFIQEIEDQRYELILVMVFLEKNLLMIVLLKYLTSLPMEEMAMEYLRSLLVVELLTITTISLPVQFL